MLEIMGLFSDSPGLSVKMDFGLEIDVVGFCCVLLFGSRITCNCVKKIMLRYINMIGLRLNCLHVIV